MRERQIITIYESSYNPGFVTASSWAGSSQTFQSELLKVPVNWNRPLCTGPDDFATGGSETDGPLPSRDHVSCWWFHFWFQIHFHLFKTKVSLGPVTACQYYAGVEVINRLSRRQQRLTVRCKLRHLLCSFVEHCKTARFTSAYRLGFAITGGQQKISSNNNIL